MSSKKGYSLEQVDDCDCDVAVATPNQTEEYPTDLSTFTPPKKTKVSNEEFVAKWLLCDSYTVMAFNTDMTVSAVQARATRLRKAGVQLPSFTRATRKTKAIDVVGLNSTIDSNTTGETTNE